MSWIQHCVYSLFYFVIGFVVFWGANSNAGSRSAIVYQGRIIKPDGLPLTTRVNFNFTIKSSNNCILWSENQSINFEGTSGIFSALVGDNTTGVNTSSGTHSFSQVFQNSNSISGLTGCDSGTVYFPSSEDDRVILASFNDGSGPQQLPGIPVKSVPFANEAASALALRGTKISETLPLDNQILKYNAVLDEWVPGAGAGGGSVNAVDLSLPSSVFGPSSGVITGTGTLQMNFLNQSAAQIFAGPVSGGATVPSFRSLAATDLPSLPASKITAGTLSTSVGGTGLIPSGAADANKIYGINSLGTGSEFKSLNAGSGVSIDSSVAGVLTISSASSNSLASSTGTLDVNRGGTGLNNSLAGFGALLIGNGSGFTLGTLNSNNGILVTNTSGAINVSTNAQTTNANNTLIMRNGTGGFAAGSATLQGLTLQGLGTVGIATPATANYSLTLPQNTGASGMALITDGSGVLSWGSVGGGGGGDFKADGSVPMTGALQGTFGTAALPSYTFFSDTGLGLFRAGAGSLGISTAGVERIRVDSAGNVGIGTTSPAEILDIRRSTNAGISAVIDNGNAGSSAFSGFTAGANSGSLDFRIYSTAAGGNAQLQSSASSLDFNAYNAAGILRFKTGAAQATRMTINSSGSVGIGTTSPSAVLDVGSTVGNFANDILIASGTNNTTLVVQTGATATAGPNLKLSNQGPGGRSYSIYSTGSSNGPGAGFLEFTDLTATSTRMVISPAGSVGIGAASPSAKLDVNGDLSAASTYEGVSSYTNTGASYSITSTATNVVRLTLDSNTTITLPTFTAPTGRVYNMTLFLKQDAIGGRSMTLAGSGSDTIKWDGGVVPLYSTTATKMTIINLIKPADETVWYGSMVWREN